MAAAGEFAEEHEKHGQGYVAAPVFGNPDAARARERSSSRQAPVIRSSAAVHCSTEDEADAE
jgi:hypothetical protein